MASDDPDISDVASLDEQIPNDQVADSKTSFSKCSPWIAWLQLCRFYFQLHCTFFRKFTNIIVQHPIKVLVLSLVSASVLAVGFVWLDLNTRTEQLFIPQGSQAMKDLTTADTYFPIKTREAAVVVTPVIGNNILSKECFEDVLTIHKAIININGYSEVCVRLKRTQTDQTHSEDCLMLSPMEIFSLNSSKFNNIEQTLSLTLRDTSYIMSNGRPCSYNFPRIFGKMTTKNGDIVSAQALRMTFSLKDVESNKVLDWEEKFLNEMIKQKNNLKHVKLFYSADRSLDDSVKESTSGDVTLFSITIAVMMSFTCAMLGKLRNPLTGHSLLSCTGLLAVAFGIASAFGLCMFIGIPFISITSIIPFLVIGIGIDDMFIIIDELDRQKPEANTVTRLVDTMSHVGATITMTTLTDLVAFAVSTSSKLPAITHFCTYAALSITFSYLFLITFFIVFVVYDDKRIKEGKRDCLPCCQSPVSLENIAPEPQDNITSKVMKSWGTLLMKPLAKTLVIIIALGLLSSGIYGAVNIEEDFDPQMLAKDGSYFKEFFKVIEQYFPAQTLEVSIIVEGKINYSNPDIQKEIQKLSDIAKSNKHYSDTIISWINVFTTWTKNFNLTTDGEKFFPYLKTFLNVSTFASFRRDIIFNSEETDIIASRILVYYEGSFSAISQRDAMLSLREDLSSKSSLPVFPINRLFVYFEQYAITRYETIRNLIIASLTILLITSPSLANPGVIFLVFFSFVSLVVELLGLMYIWNVTLNGISMLIIVMAIGFAVDYSAHIAHAFVTSSKCTPEERVVDSLSTVGASVIMGGISTFLGVSIIAFASSEVFRIFFRMFFGIVLLGLVHGLCFLPVLLSVFCRYHIEIKTRRLESEVIEPVTDSRGKSENTKL